VIIRYDTSIEKVEKYIEFLKQTIDEGTANVPSVELINSKKFTDADKNVNYLEYISNADYHYFISRVLFMHHINEYSLFSGQQCIENYLKGYIRLRGGISEKTHRLYKLLAHCISISPTSD
jgi:hypothetical protein